MDFVIAFSQLLLAVIFLFTLKCELSKECSDSILFVSVRTFIMCTSAIAFCALFEKHYHTLSFLILVCVPLISGGLYTTLETISPSKLKHIKEDYDAYVTREAYGLQQQDPKVDTNQRNY